MKISRRKMLAAITGTVGGSLLLGAGEAEASQIDVHGKGWDKSYSGGEDKNWNIPGLPNKDYTPVITPNGSSLDWKIVDGIKVYHLIAEEVEHEFAPGLTAHCWGYNGQVHGPTIEAVEGDRIRIYLTNKLPAPTTAHWHGVFLPNGMDGVGGLSQRAIQPGETFKYEFTVKQHGTFMYHSHHDEMTQMAMGLMGMMVFHPRKASIGYEVDRDFVIMLGEWDIKPGTRRPNPNVAAGFNVLTMNARCFPGTETLVAKKGDKVRIRFGNLSAMDHHPIHLHGHYFKIVATDGGQIPITAQIPETTVLVATGTTRDIEFIASEAGDWGLHCHMTHHVMNQMGHDTPNMLGMNGSKPDQKINTLLPSYMSFGANGMAEHGKHLNMGHHNKPENSIPMSGFEGPFDYITMGGMFTLVKIREDVQDYADPGWFKNPEGTVADVASEEELSKDGIDVVIEDSTNSENHHEH